MTIDTLELGILDITLPFALNSLKVENQVQETPEFIGQGRIDDQGWEDPNVKID